MDKEIECKFNLLHKDFENYLETSKNLLADDMQDENDRVAIVEKVNHATSAICVSISNLVRIAQLFSETQKQNFKTQLDNIQKIIAQTEMHLLNRLNESKKKITFYTNSLKQNLQKYDNYQIGQANKFLGCEKEV
jgi:hypothetical protein